VVSIPEKPDGRVLALVEEPGKPSELITVPEPGQPRAGAPSSDAQSEKPAGGTSSGDGAAAENKPAPTEEMPAAQDNQQTAAAPAAPKPAPAQPADGPLLAVEAVEIEGRRIFVAGSADPGRLVRAYANEVLLGQTETSEAGRFLVETERDLPVGDYIIRVDALAPNGEKVLARVAVPFEREAGENIAAVALPSAGSSEMSQPDTSGNANQPAAAASAEPAAGKQPRAGAAPAGEAKVETPATMEKPAETGTASVESPNSAAQPTPLEPGVAAIEAPAAPGQAAPAVGGDIAAAPVETVAPKLQNVDNSVIIRRGDTLWRISKRVYGRGVRYSTIYLANQEQIRDPNMIWPGQVFSVPQKTDEGEKADMSRLGTQAVQPPVQQ
jgi:nucleoid-associated protein YgaU